MYPFYINGVNLVLVIFNFTLQPAMMVMNFIIFEIDAASASIAKIFYNWVKWANTFSLLYPPCTLLGSLTCIARVGLPFVLFELFNEIFFEA